MTRMRHKSKTPIIVANQDLPQNRDMDSTYFLVPIINHPEETTWDESDDDVIASSSKEPLVESPPSATVPALIEKWLSGKLTITTKTTCFVIFIAYIILTGWLFIQDNGAGKVDTLEGLGHFGIKFLVITSFLILVELIMYIMGRTFKRSDRKQILLGKK